MSEIHLPEGVELHELTPHRDGRGVFTELFRAEWGSTAEPVQWNAVRSNADVLRGVHVHLVHDDYLTVVDGRMTLGLCDLRPTSPTYRMALTLDLDSAAPRAVAIPHGVAHGFHFEADSIHVYAVSHYWNLDDELGCRWDDPGLGIPWTHKDAHISQRDADLPSLDQLLERLSAHYDSEPSVST
ncbi:MAG: dTDP-4-dehydrorhamnose 3,5-epimerase family protein [Thermoleophilaceae bacterium]|nr:dTDP-4-dehydrorhamnose 3,5-epimerase family protein [Thermoleophilaceae bacterium]